MDGISVIAQILDLRPETRVILETALEKNDEKVRDVISYGAYGHLAKPYGYEEVRQVVDVIRKEDDAIHDTGQDMELIRTFLKNYSRISMAMLTECTGKSKSDLITILDGFEKNGNIVKSGTLKEISCDKCGTVKVKQFFHCPSCYSYNFKKDRVIEHYGCGNISPARSYKNEKCPSCNNDVKVLGVDYRIIDNFYFCNDCGDKFQNYSGILDASTATTSLNWTAQAGAKVLAIK